MAVEAIIHSCWSSIRFRGCPTMWVNSKEELNRVKGQDFLLPGASKKPSLIGS